MQSYQSSACSACGAVFYILSPLPYIGKLIIFFLAWDIFWDTVWALVAYSVSSVQNTVTSPSSLENSSHLLIVTDSPT